jgi:sulfopropanediol 3-dehydrogenase
MSSKAIKTASGGGKTASDTKVADTVATIIDDVRQRGDDAVRAYSQRFDGWSPASFLLDSEEIEKAVATLPKQTVDDIRTVQSNVRSFAQHQLDSMREFEVETMPGVFLGQKHIPVAKVAGVARVTACTPPIRGEVPAATIAAMHLGGADQIYLLGGVQAVAAMAIGTESIAKVDLLAGPGNAYVAEAKRQVFGRVGIDMVAGPSEVVIVAEAVVEPAWIAADLLAQAEHDERAQAILITDDRGFAGRVVAAVEAQLAGLARGEIAGASWRAHGAVIVVGRIEEARALVDALAPEHLQLIGAHAEALAPAIRHAGAIFLGPLTPEVIGDYVGGPNHVLPTGRTARFASGLAVYDFLKRTTLLGCDASSFARLGPAAAALARAEGLEAHALAVERRLGTTG